MQRTYQSLLGLKDAMKKGIEDATENDSSVKRAKVENIEVVLGDDNELNWHVTLSFHSS